MPPFIYSSLSDLVVVILCGYLLAIYWQMGFAGIAAGLAISACHPRHPHDAAIQKGRVEIDPRVVLRESQLYIVHIVQGFCISLYLCGFVMNGMYCMWR